MPQYQGIWSLPQQSQALTNQQWVTDPDFRNTTLLLQADGAGNGSQNQTFLDSSTNNFYISRFGNATQGSFSPFCRPDGQWSNYFTSAGLSIPYAAALQLQNTNWTIESYFNLSSASAEFCVMGASNGGGGVPKYFMGGNWSTSFTYNANRATFFTYTGGDRFIDVPYVWEIGKWYHMAAVYTNSNTTITLYINGVNVGSMAYGIDNVTGNILIGRNGENGGPINGYISNFRYIVGTSLYTSNFTPSTTPLTAITNTKILTCQSNNFIDNSGNNRTVSVFTGTPSVRAFGPFAPALQWTPDVVGGSGYFDGSGDYLVLPNNSCAVGSSNFTLESWIYPLNRSATYQIFNSQTDRASVGGSSWGVLLTNTNGYFYSAWYVGGTTYELNTSVAPPLNAWSHVALVRTGGTMSLYVNGTRYATRSDMSTNSINIGSTTYGPAIGSNGSGNSDPFLGYMSSVRLLIGSGGYDATASTLSVPTTPLTSITNTTFLTNFTTAGIYDATCQTNWETKALKDGTRVDTSIKKNGSGSFYFDGTQAYAPTERLLPSENYPSLIFGTGNFTIESWLYCIGKPTNSTTSGIWDQRPGVNGTYINFVVDFGGYGGAAATPTLVLYADSATRLRSDYIPLQRWFHAVLCRSNGITRMFINGKLACTPLADTRNYLGGGSAGNYRPVIGQTDGGDAFYGFMDDFRASRFCRYISDFIPPKQALPRQ